MTVSAVVAVRSLGLVSRALTWGAALEVPPVGLELPLQLSVLAPGLPAISLHRCQNDWYVRLVQILLLDDVQERVLRVCVERRDIFHTKQILLNVHWK
eukprot:9491869-Pyramimonas_sp.AAC.1